MAVPQKILPQKNPTRMKKMYENVKSETITISKEEYDTLKQYRNIALELGELCRQLRGDSA